MERTVAGLAGASFPTALTSLLELVLLAVAAWAAVVLGLTLVGGRAAVVAARLLPRAVRGALVAGVVTTLSVGTAHAAGSPSPDPRPAAATLDGLVLPDRPTSEVRDAPSAGPPTRSSPDTVVVVPGDSLWSIAASRSGPRAGAADVAAATERWYQQNREVVGPDPDLLQPGQRLTAPRESA